MNETLGSVLKTLHQNLQELYGDRLKQLILYGSQARGDARPDSDVDILIVLEGAIDYRAEIRRTSELIADLSLRYQTVISRAFVSLERLQTEQSPFLMNVRREGILV